MRTKLIIPLLFLGILAIGQNSPTLDTIKFKRGGKLYKLVITPTSLTLNGTTYQISSGSWTQSDPTHIRPSVYMNQIKYPGIRYMGQDVHPTQNALVWWNWYDSTLSVKNPDPTLQSPVYYIGSDTLSGWRITTQDKVLRFEFKTVNGWIMKQSIDTTGNFSNGM